MINKMVIHIFPQCLQALSDYLEKITGAMCVFSLFIMAISVFLGIFFRYILLSPLSWSEELARYLMIWLAFLSSGIALKKGEHIGVEYLINKLPYKILICLSLGIKILIFFFLCIVTREGFSLLLFIFGTGQTTAALGILTAWVYMAVPVGTLFMIIYLLPLTMDNLFVIFNIKR